MRKKKNNLEKLILEQQITISTLLKNSNGVPVKLPDMLLTEAVKVWINYSKIYHPKLLKSYPGRYPFVLSFFRGKSLRSLSKQDIMDFIHLRKTQFTLVRKKGVRRGKIVMIPTRTPVSNSTIHTNITLIASLFRAVKTMLPGQFDDLISPTRSVQKLPRSKSKKSMGDFYYNIPELKRLQSGSPLSPLAPVFQVMLRTGCRAGEVLSLKWGNVNLISKTITFLDTKNGTDRDVPISDGLLNFLMSIYLRDSSCSNVVCTSFGHPYRSYPRYSLVKYIRDCGVSYKGVHAVRHGVITALRKKFGERITKPIVGHSTNSVHELYTHFEWSELITAVQSLDFS